jgi:hypothetical protein
MNEQIWKLAEQIVCFEQDMDGSMEPDENGQWIRADDLEKFAELIVKECAAIGERYADGNYEVRNQILVQFGLEEPEE